MGFEGRADVAEGIGSLKVATEYVPGRPPSPSKGELSNTKSLWGVPPSQRPCGYGNGVHDDEKDTGAYQAFGDVQVELGHKDVSDYRRELDIVRAVHTVSYTAGGTRYKREYFASNPAGVMVFRLTADKAGAHTATIKLTVTKVTSSGKRYAKLKWSGGFVEKK